jgi:hypothetical protein
MLPNIVCNLEANKYVRAYMTSQQWAGIMYLVLSHVMLALQTRDVQIHRNTSRLLMRTDFFHILRILLRH